MCSKPTRTHRALRSMTTQLNSKLITLNSNRKQKRILRQKGFTLIELMVVTAIAGVLGAVAVPKFLGARDIANAKAQISAAVGVAKECQTWIQTNGEGMTAAPTKNGSLAAVTCTVGSASSVESGAFKIPTGVTNIQCLGATSTGGETKATIAIDGTTGNATCTLA